MSLATRCTACGTVFRVVQDQLKVSEGWVRCGRCNEVFNALEGLFDLERDEPPEWRPAAQGTEADVLPPGAAAAFDAGAEIDLDVGGGPGSAQRDPNLVRRMDAQLFGPRLTDTDTPLPEAVINDDAVPAPRRLDPDFDAPRPAHADPLAAEAQAATIAHAVPEDAAAFEAHSDDAPAFIRHAEQRARWHSPRARALLSLAALLLIGLLAAQGMVHFRDLLAARWPQARPLLNGACEAAGCRIGTPRRIDDVQVDSSALARAEAPDTFRLSISLRNRAAYAVAVPSIDLSLTDAAGQLVARRALAPNDFRAAPESLPPGAETPLQVLLAANGGKVTGYTVEIFYP